MCENCVSMKKLIFLPLIWGYLTTQYISANSDSTSSKYNIHSNFNVSEKDILWRRTIWRQFDLREPRNEGFYALDGEITKAILGTAREGKINIYTSDSLSYGQTLSQPEFVERLRVERFEMKFSKEDIPYLENELVISDLNKEHEHNQDLLMAHDLYQIEIKEELIFDSKHSRMIRDIISFRLILSADHPQNLYGVDKTIATFSYKELAENVFNIPNGPRFYLSKNLAHPISFDHAIKMNYHYAPISKLNNAQNLYLSDQCNCNQEEVLWKSLELEYNLMEYETKFWMSK